jgi:hypothetical protein
MHGAWMVRFKILIMALTQGFNLALNEVVTVGEISGHS